MINLRNIFNSTINLILLIITITLFITLIIRRDNIVFLKKIFIKIGISLIIIFLILDYILKFYKKKHYLDNSLSNLQKFKTKYYNIFNNNNYIGFNFEYIRKKVNQEKLTFFIYDFEFEFLIY